MICISHWQSERVAFEDQEFIFSPFGVSQIDGWVLMRWWRTKRCNTGYSHKIEYWSNQSSLTGIKEPKAPLIPEEVWDKLGQKTENKKLEPYPGGN